MSAQFGDGGPLRFEYGVGHQPGVAAFVGDGPYVRLADGRVGQQGGTDLGRLHPLAADLDLVVAAAQEVQFAVGAEPGEVAGAVEPGAGAAAEGVGHEALGGLLGPAEVAAGQQGAAEVELAGEAGRDGGEVGVQQVHLDAGQRAADRQGVRLGQRTVGEVVQGGGDGGLGQAVGVDHGHGAVPAPGGERVGVRGVAADDQQAQRGGQRARLGVQVPGPLVPVRGGQVGEGDALFV